MKAGSQPGERRGGRTKGTPNKITVDLQAKLARLKCDPITGLAKIAENPKTTLELRVKIYAELAQYVYPKRKALEHSGSVELGEIMQRLAAGRERMKRKANE